MTPSSMRNLNLDFIFRYVALLGAITDAPQIYNEVAALVAVSTAAGRNFVMMSTPDSRLFGRDKGAATGLWLNLWMIIIGKSRITRKTTVFRKLSEILEEAVPNARLADDFTPEAGIMEMQALFNPNTNAAKCYWINDEISGFFDALKKKDYMATTDTLLSKIYNGDSFSRSLKSGKVEVLNPYMVAFLCSTEYLPRLFTENLILQGFLNRFLIVHGQHTQRKPARPDTSDAEKKEADELVAWLKAVEQVNQTNVMDFSSDARVLLEVFEDKTDAMLRENDLGLEESFYGNLPVQLKKLAANYRLARLTMAELQNSPLPIIVIGPEDVKRAQEFLEKAVAGYKLAMELRLVRTDKIVEYSDLFLRVLKDNGGKMTRKEMYRRLHGRGLNAKAVEDAYEDLEKRGLVSKSTERLSPTGPLTIVYGLIEEGGFE